MPACLGRAKKSCSRPVPRHQVRPIDGVEPIDDGCTQRGWGLNKDLRAKTGEFIGANVDIGVVQLKTGCVVALGADSASLSEAERRIASRYYPQLRDVGILDGRQFCDRLIGG